MASAIDVTKPVAGNPTTESVRANFAAAKSEIELLQQTAGVGPQGPIGPAGPSGTITVGTVTTGPAGGNAAVTNTGTPQAATLNFTLPRGDSGTAGGGITEAQAVEAVRSGHPDFVEVPVTTAVAPAAPNIAEPPTVNAGWTPETGGTATDTYTHAPGGGTGVLAYPITGGFAPGQWIQIIFNCVNNTVPPFAPGATSVPNLFTVYLRTAPTTTGSQITVGAAVSMAGGRTIQVPNTSAITYPWLVVVPLTTFNGTFTLTSVFRRNGVLNSSSFEIQGMPVIRKGTTLAIGGGATMSTGATNTIFGIDAGRMLTTAGNGLYVGYQAGMNNTTGGTITAVGYRALLNNLTGSGNCAFGYDAMTANINGSQNTALGYPALNNNINGNNNTAVGWCSIQHNRNGHGNTAVGYASLRGKYQGDDNVAIGNTSGTYLQPSGSTYYRTANRGVFVGAWARPYAEDQTNEIIIGAYTNGHGSNTITLGNDLITHLHCNVSTISAISDTRVKEQIQPANLDTCLNAVKNLPVSRWAWQPIAGAHPDKHVTGFMAEDLVKIFPKSVTEQDEYLVVRDTDGKARMTSISETVENDPGDPEGQHVETHEVEQTTQFKGLQRVNLQEILPTLWGAVQQLIARIDQLEQQKPQPLENQKSSVFGKKR